MTLPFAAKPFVEFPAILRAHGFAISTDQTISFLEAIGLLGPTNMADIRRAGLAMLAIPKERQAEYDALFRAYFIGQTVSAPTELDEEDDGVDAFEEASGEQEIEVQEDEEEAGGEVSVTEALSHRTFEDLSDDEVLSQFARLAHKRLPRKNSRRRKSSRKGDAFDMKRSLKQAVQRDGEIFELFHTKKKTKQRTLVLLIDVSGSMKEQSETSLRFAHTLMQVADAVEVFTFGTRLTRITPALKVQRVEQALDNVSRLIADFDGGTRIGEALNALLSVPRFAATMRGASVQILSDGLERDNPNEMVDAVRRISRLAWRVDWLTPLAADENYVPKTEALLVARPYLTSLSDGGSLASICEHIVALTDHQTRRAA
jgi:uncharacterized protein with von Willebrand factor type A (vWA) domain